MSLIFILIQIGEHYFSSPISFRGALKRYVPKLIIFSLIYWLPFFILGLIARIDLFSWPTKLVILCLFFYYNAVFVITFLNVRTITKVYVTLAFIFITFSVSVIATPIVLETISNQWYCFGLTCPELIKK